MQIVAGRADDSMTVREALKQVPTRLIRFVKRVASLPRGRYVLYLAVGDDGMIDWQVSPIERLER